MNDQEKKKIISEHMSALGKKGGNVTKNLHGREYFVNMAKKRVGVRWSKKWKEENK